jgi:nucleotide-binding universal stress UspA family protein
VGTNVDRVVETATSTILLAVEATPESRAVIAAAVQMALRSHADVLVLSVREREHTRGLVWDRRPLEEIAEVVSHAVYELQRVGLKSRGIIRIAVSGRVAETIIDVAHQHRADTIIIGSSGRSSIGAFLFGSVSPRVVRLADLPVVAVPVRSPSGGPARRARLRTPRAIRTPQPR